MGTWAGLLASAIAGNDDTKRLVTRIGLFFKILGDERNFGLGSKTAKGFLRFR